MKKITKLLSVLCAVSLVFATITMPMVASASNAPILSVDYEPEAIFSENFDGATVSEVTKFNGYFAPKNEVKTDANENKYVKIDAGKYISAGVEASDWVFGGYKFDEAMKLRSAGSGSYRVSFDFKDVVTSSYGSIALSNEAASQINAYNNFKILNVNEDGQLCSGGDGSTYGAVLTLNDGFTYTASEWNHFELEMNMTDQKYSVKVTRPGVVGSATGTGYFDYDIAYDGITVIAGATADMDNILVEKLFSDVAMVTFEANGTPDVTLTKDGDNTYASVAANWKNGGYPLSSAISSGEWEISFRFNLSSTSAQTNVSLANMQQVVGNEYSQFRLLSYQGPAGNDDQPTYPNEITVNRYGKVDGDLVPTLNTWYDYKMILNKTNHTYTAEISDGTNKAVYSGNVEREWDFDGFMIGADTQVLIDDIIVAAYTPEVKTTNISEFSLVSGTNGALPPLVMANQTVKAKLSGGYYGTEGAVVVLAEYVNGVLVEAAYEPLGVTNADFTDKVTTISVTTDSADSKVKAFVWDGLTKLIPLTGSIER